jgi:hypothetical protein
MSEAKDLLLSASRHCLNVFVRLEPRNAKWAASQEAVTFPWLSAHSIRTGIGGDIYIVFPSPRLSRINFQHKTVSICDNSTPKGAPMIDTPVGKVLF